MDSVDPRPRFNLVGGVFLFSGNASGMKLRHSWRSIYIYIEDLIYEQFPS